MREMKAIVQNVGATLKINGKRWAVVAYLFAEDTVLLAEIEKELQSDGLIL